MNFNAEKCTKACIEGIREWFDKNGKGCKAVLGISGGLDSTVTAYLLKEALGAERVLGVLMPNGFQSDFEDAQQVITESEIDFVYANISAAVDAVYDSIRSNRTLETISDQTKINLPPRIRMATLYAISQSVNGRVINTCNLSEDFIGYNTIYGDSAGDFGPIACFTKTEIREIGKYLGISSNLLNKAPADGLCGKTDEDNLGFTYEQLDKYIREGKCDDINVERKIRELNRKNMFKLEPMAIFVYK